MTIFKLFNFNNVNICHNRIFLCSREHQAWISTKKLKTLGIPLPPVRPLNAFLKFQQILRPTIIKKQPQISFANFMKIIANEWKNCDPHKKKLLKDQYNISKKNYFLELENYNKSLTTEQFNIIRSMENGKKKVNKLTEKQNKYLKIGYPKRPTTSFFLFVIEKQDKKNCNMKQNEWIKILSKEWKNLSEQEKEKYKKLCQVELNKYKNDKITWKEKLIKQKNNDIDY